MAFRFAGVDCAVQARNVGVALGLFDNGFAKIVSARQCSAADRPAAVLKKWHDEDPLSLIALDAPLGWPQDLSVALSPHFAGNHLAPDANKLFRRETDREIYRRLGKQPLDVGANFIARTAKAALDLLEQLRSFTGESIPLTWEMSVPESLSAIEVYPAATIRSSNLPVIDYKKRSQIDGRRRIVASLPAWFETSSVRQVLEKSSDVLDAVLCALAAIEFMQGRCVPPADSQRATKEGWIWAGPAPTSAHQPSA